MADPGDEIAAGASGHSRLRASDADREQVIETLKAAFVQGRLTKDELGLRVGQVLASRIYAELAAVTADIPAGLSTARRPAPTRAQGEQAVLRPGPVIAAATAVYAGLWAFVVVVPSWADNQVVPLLIVSGWFAYLAILIASVGRMITLRREKRAGGQSPRRPVAGADGPASQRLPSAGPGRQLPPGDDGHWHAAEAAPIARLRLLPS
jgi:DUF1707 SHOCT-like domain